MKKLTLKNKQWALSPQTINIALNKQIKWKKCKRASLQDIHEYERKKSRGVKCMLCASKIDGPV